MKPIIKWPGGKSTELKQFMSLLPDYDRYIEPFVGGGALYFALNPEKAVIGDTSGQLIELYRLVQSADQELKRLLDLYSQSFAALKASVAKQKNALLSLYAFYELACKNNMDMRQIRPHLHLTEQIIGEKRIMTELILDRDEFFRIMEESVEDKLLRTAELNQNHNFSEKVLQDHILTGFMSGFYLYFRSVFNQLSTGRLVKSRQFETACFYFVREYCYGARYNSKGEFNIPYGGLTYNTKDLGDKVSAIYSQESIRLLQRTQIYCEDFESLMRRLTLTDRDFLFLDPPYETDSDYEGNAFSRDDHQRLAKLLYDTKAQFLLIIQNTDSVYNLYEGRFRILAFENNYVHNVNRPGERNTEHLIVTNIPEGQVPWFRENHTLI